MSGDKLSLIPISFKGRIQVLSFVFNFNLKVLTFGTQWVMDDMKCNVMYK